MKRPFVTLLLAAAVLVVAVLASETRLGRVAGVRVPSTSLPEVYVQRKTGDDVKCLVSDRAGVTLRRSEPTLDGSSWKCHWPTGAAGTLAALSGKNPSRLFVPFEEVVDPVHPLLYEAVRAASKVRGDFVDGDVRDVENAAPDAAPPLGALEGLVLPRVRWVQLSLDRRFRGLYLEVRLPGKRFADNRALGRIELLAADDRTLRCWNRKLKDACTLYGSYVAEGWWPEPAWRDDTAWLASLLEGSLDEESVPRTFALAESAEPPLLPWPLPFSLPRALGVEAGARWSDPRFTTWSVAARSETVVAEAPETLRAWLAGEAGALLESRVDALDAALGAHCEVRDCDPVPLRARLAASPSGRELTRLAAGDP